MDAEAIPIARPHHILLSLETLISEPPFVLLAISATINLLFIYGFIFLSETTFTVFFFSNTAFYVVVSLALTVLVAGLGGLAIAQTVYILSRRMALRRGQGAARGAVGAVIGALSAGCPSCASLVLPVFGIAGSLAAFPLAGLELKIIALLILVDALWEGSRVMSGVCQPFQTKLVTDEGQTVSVNFNRETLRRLKPVLVFGVAVAAVYLLPLVPAQYRVNFALAAAPLPEGATRQAAISLTDDTAQRIDQVNPPDGYSIAYTFGDIGPQLIAAGAIDTQKFAQVFVQDPLTADQRAILNNGSDETITINRDNAHFLLNLFWALGLANQNAILDTGPLTQYGDGQITRFASTGGWTLASKPVADVYSSTPILTLTPEQQSRVQEAADNTYRPCCNNSTAFADCNHGMAMLGLFELMASQGATTDELFEAAKYFNAFWFPQQSLDLATYFEAAEGTTFDRVDARTVVSAQYSSGSGWSDVRQWLQSQGLVEQVQGGGGCGT